MSAYGNSLYETEGDSAKRSMGRQASLDSTENEESVLEESDTSAQIVRKVKGIGAKNNESLIIEDSLNQTGDSFVAPVRKHRQVVTSDAEEDEDEESGESESSEEEDDEDEDGDDEDQTEEEDEEDEPVAALPVIRSPKPASALVNSTKIADWFDEDLTKETSSLSMVVDKSATDLENTNKKEEASSLLMSRISDGINRNLVINDSVEQTSDVEVEAEPRHVIENSAVLDGSSIRQAPGSRKLIESATSEEEARPSSASQSDHDDSGSRPSRASDIEVLDESSLNVPRAKSRPKVVSSSEEEPAVIDITQYDSSPRRKPEVILVSDSPAVQAKPKALADACASPNMFSRKLNDQKPVASWSPNYEQVKAKVHKTMQESKPRTIQMIDITQNEFNSQAPAPVVGQEVEDDDVNSIDRLKNLKFQANVVRSHNDAQNTRHYSYEHQLKELSEQMIGVLEEKPDPDEVDDDFVKSEEAKALIPKGLKVNLLNHQIYSLRWLKWREQTYPFGGILADDMGLGKTLTILSYLKLMKDRREDAMKAKLDELNEDDEAEEDEDEDEREIRRKRFEKKYSSRRALTKPLKTLIILPASLMHQWEGEIKNRFERDTFKYLAYHGNNRNKFSYNLDDYDIVFTTYELVSREVMIVDKQGNDIKVSDSPLGRIKWKRIILDEAHRIKNHATKGSKAICFLRAKYRIAITGTPIHNSLTDFYSLVKFLHFEPLNDLSLWGYIFASEKFAKSVPRHNAVERQDRLNNWLGLLSSYLILRRTKADKIKGTEQKIVDLPEKSVETIRFGLNEHEKKIYELIFSESKQKVDDFLKQRLLGKNSGGNFVSEILVYLLRLRQACCHMSLLNECIDKSLLQNMKLEADGLDGLMQNMTLSGESPNQTAVEPDLSDIKNKDVCLSQCFSKTWISTKLQRLIDMMTKILDENAEDKIIVVSQWTSMLKIVSQFLESEDIGFCAINGEVQLAKRNEIVEQFNKKFYLKQRVMLLSLTAGGVGLNLIGANHMFLLDIHWNPALEQQAADRIYRVGQKKDVFVYKFICENTIEERIQEIQAKKMDIANKVCSASAAGATIGNVPNTKLSINDFKQLFKGFDSDKAPSK